MDVAFVVAAALRISVPYTLAALGATFSERSGVINIALEGIMLNSALAYVLGAHWSGNPWVGVLSSIVAGIATAALHAVVTIRFRADQITSGLGINLLAAGLTKVVLVAVFQSSSNSTRVVGLPEWSWLPFGSIPAVGPVLTTPLVILTVVLVLVGQAVLFRSVFGLRLRSVGERPEAAASLGLSVAFYRYAGELHYFTDGMTGGRGYIAIAAMIVGKWTPVGAAAACLLFGAAEALQIVLQGARFPSELLQMLPYLVTMLVLAGFIGRSVPPRSLGEPYDPEHA